MTEEDLNKYLDVAKIQLSDFFGIKALDINLVILESREDINKLKGHKTEPWVIGFTIENNLYILNPDKTKNLLLPEEVDYQKLITHEATHIFYENISNGEDYPIWLNEGLACYLGKQNLSNPNPTDFILIDNYFEKIDKNGFSVGCYFVYELIKDFGNNKIKRLINSFKKYNQNLTKNDFYFEFEKTYKKPFNEIKNNYLRKLGK